MTADRERSNRPALFLWHDAFWKSGCPGNVGYTLLALWKFADNDTLRAFPSRDRLAEMCSTHTRSIDRHINEAIRHGWVVRERRGKTGRATEYRLTFGRPWPENRPIDRSEPASKEAQGASLQTLVTDEQTLVSVETDTGVTPTAHGTTHGTVETRSGVADHTADDQSVDVEKNNLGELLAGDESGWPDDIDGFKVNASHVSKANEARVSAVAVAGVFRDWCRAADVISWDLDAKFGALLDEIWMDGDPDSAGFVENGLAISRLASVDGCECVGGCVWWQHPVYRAELAVGAA